MTILEDENNDFSENEILIRFQKDRNLKFYLFSAIKHSRFIYFSGFKTNIFTKSSVNATKKFSYTSNTLLMDNIKISRIKNYGHIIQKDSSITS